MPSSAKRARSFAKNPMPFAAFAMLPSEKPDTSSRFKENTLALHTIIAVEGAKTVSAEEIHPSYGAYEGGRGAIHCHGSAPVPKHVLIPLTSIGVPRMRRGGG